MIIHVSLNSKYDLNRAIDKVEKFLSINYLMISLNLYEYMANIQRRSRIIFVIVTRVAILLTTIKFGICAVMSNKAVSLALMDISYMLGNPILASSIMSVTSLAIFAVAITVNYQEHNHTFHLLELLYMIKNDLIKFPLTFENHRSVTHSIFVNGSEHYYAEYKIIDDVYVLTLSKDETLKHYMCCKRYKLGILHELGVYKNNNCIMSWTYSTTSNILKR